MPLLYAVPSELPILMREHFNRWYKLRAYYLANKLADFFVQFTATFIYTIVVYYMSDQLPESRRLGLYMLMCFATSLVGQAAGLIVGSGLKVQVGLSFLFFIVFVLIYRPKFTLLSRAFYEIGARILFIFFLFFFISEKLRKLD